MTVRALFPNSTLLSPRALRWLMLAAILAGVVCRVRQYAADRSYWHDEACIVLNVRSHSTHNLVFNKLDYDQAAPPLFLIAERGLYVAAGGSEFILRAFPLATGIASVFLFALLARRILGSGWDILATGLFALSEMLVYHAAEVKPYNTDALATVLMLWLAVGPGESWSLLRRFGALCLAATVLVWLSYPAALVFAALALALAPALIRTVRSGWLVFLAGVLPPAVGFLYIIKVIVPLQQNDMLANYWVSEFLDWHKPLGWPWWLLKRLISLCDYPLRGTGPLVLIAVVIAIIALWRARRRPLLAMLAGPTLITILAAVAHRYPFDGARLTTFLDPLVILLAVIGFAEIARHVDRYGIVTFAPAALVLAVAVFWAVDHLAHPINRGNLRPIAEYIAQHRQPGDGIYVTEPREFACYWPAHDPDLRDVVDPADEIPWKRFWIVWSFSNAKIQRRFEPLAIWARQFATQRDRKLSDGGEAVLFEINSTPIPSDEINAPKIATPGIRSITRQKTLGPTTQSDSIP